ncbi:hypothetical protein DSL92_06455 [Billgrantia gudaonensis]|uniref:Uncharacterized protein n=1 Tax=Billgrantia gudaonensis TaxID=376427 RepID=A0A432JIV5_9GAMM|nr:hypothetical protein DSL92_06455 [Halomonas gudaonensis]
MSWWRRHLAKALYRRAYRCCGNRAITYFSALCWASGHCSSKGDIQWTPTFMLTLLWLVLVLSIQRHSAADGAFKRGEASPCSTWCGDGAGNELFD